MTLAHAKKIVKDLKEHNPIEWKENNFDYICEESMEGGDYKATCKVPHARSFYVDEIINKDEDTVTIKLNPWEKSDTPNPLEITCDNRKGSREKCTIQYKKPNGVSKVVPWERRFEKPAIPDIYHTKYRWEDTERWFNDNPKEFFRIIVSADKGELANISIGFVVNPDWDFRM